MRKAAFLMAVLLLSAVWVVAQTTGTGQPQTATQPSSQTGSMAPGTGQNPQIPNSTGQMPGSTQPGANPSATTTPSTQTAPATPQAGTGAQAGATAPAATGPQQTIEGCLGGTPGEYSLTTKSGQVYMLSGDGSLIGNHVGEQVKITGAEASASNTAGATGAAAPPTSGSATGGTPYGSTGTTASQPGSPTQSQAGAMPGQTNGTTPPAGAGAGTTANPSQTQAGAAGSGSRFQVSNVTEVSNFCNMPQAH